MTVDNTLFFALVEEQLAGQPQVRLTLRGTSMLPTLHDGDTLTLSRPAGRPAVGDVVLFRYRGGHLLHRVVQRDGDRYRMQGDNCYTREEATAEDIVAVLTGATREGAEVDWRGGGRRVLRRAAAKHLAHRWLGRDGRRRLRPWYFALLAVLMWAPLNGLGIPLDNYILGLRADHLLHASVYLLCPLFLYDLYGRLGKRGQWWAVWATAVAVGLLTEGVQYLLPYRGFDVNDLVANTLGATLGWVTLLFFLHYKSVR
ncbi:MAG: VanZ family protein [Bacteroidales bacterium]|nr:VanZ family protein [Bacteroidales bacterium]